MLSCHWKHFSTLRCLTEDTHQSLCLVVEMLGSLSLYELNFFLFMSVCIVMGVWVCVGGVDWDCSGEGEGWAREKNKWKLKPKKISTWDVRSCMVCEGPIWSITAESCVYNRWNNLSNNDTTRGILWSCASGCLCSVPPNLSCSFNVFMCGICVYIRESVFACVCMHACMPANMHMSLLW